MPLRAGLGHILLQAARSDVKGYENLHGYKLRFETTWLEKWGTRLKRP
jgi:hypothetical protein